VKAYIETEISRLEMEDYVSQVLVPTEKVNSKKDGKKLMERYIFPGYVMIEANLVGEIPHNKINNKCYRFFRRNGGEPVPLRFLK
jgi:transcriptional antiterminator NusG